MGTHQVTEKQMRSYLDGLKITLIYCAETPKSISLKASSDDQIKRTFIVWGFGFEQTYNSLKAAVAAYNKL